MESEDKTLLFVVNHSDFFLSHRLPIAQAAQRQGFKVHAATMPSAAARELAALDIEWHALPLQAGGMNPLADLVLLGALCRLYKRLQPDIIHHVTIKPVLYGSMAARLTSVPAIVNALSGLGYIFRAEGIRAKLLRSGVVTLLRLGLGHPNSTFILQNPDDATLLVEKGLVAEREVALIKGSGVDPDVFAPAPEAGEPPVVVLPSRMIWDKGVGEFVEAARALDCQGIEARFVLVGKPDPNNPSSIDRQELEEWDQEGAVEWWGFCEDMPSVMQKAHVVCLPSYYGEGVPRALIEAASCERPIVTTDMPGCREIVRHGENGLLVPPKDVQALASALRKLIGDAELRRRMGRAGRALVKTEFSLQKVVEETLSVYDALLAEGYPRM